jgi:hypothetical protein
LFVYSTLETFSFCIEKVPELEAMLIFAEGQPQAFFSGVCLPASFESSF